MGRLIDIDRLCNDLMERWSIADKKKEDTIRAVMADVVTPIVVSQPTVDAVPVVRCKDCKHWSGRKYNVHINGFLPWCRFSALQREANDYCSYGERKDGENGKTD